MKLSATHSAVLLALFAGVVALSAFGQSESRWNSDDFVIRTNIQTDDQLAAALKQVEQGSLVRMSPAAFDGLLRDHRRHRDAGLSAAIVEARYRVKYSAQASGDAAFVGTAEWIVRNPNRGSAEVPLDGFQLALQQAKWSDGGEAVIYKQPADTHPHLHVPVSGVHTLNLEWSARGLPKPGETQFELRVPTTPLASLELELPAGAVPVVHQDPVVLTGPFPTAGKDSLWRVAFGGVSRLEISLRRATEQPSTLLARLTANQNLLGTEGAARFEFQIESAKTAFTELVFHHDTGFVPSAVRVPNLVGWSAVPGAGGETALVIRLREPTLSAAVVIDGAMPIPPASKIWTSPGIRLKGGVLRAEKLQITIGPTFRFRDWSAGGYRLARGELGPDQSYIIEVEPATLSAVQARRQRPSLTLVPRNANTWSATQRSDWLVNRDNETWVVKTTLMANSKPPAVIRFPLAAGWNVERVEQGGNEAVWSTAGGAARRIVVELGEAGHNSEITVRLRRTARLSFGQQITMPDLLPEGCASRTGTLMIHVESGFDVEASDPLPEALLPRVPSSSNEITRTLTSSPVSGWIVLRPRAVKYRIEAESEIANAVQSTAIRTRLTVSPENQPVDEIRLWTQCRVAEPWEWYDDKGRWVGNAVRDPTAEVCAWLLPEMPAGILPAVISAATASESASFWWRLRFPKPLEKTQVLESNFTAIPGSRRWPLPWAPHALFAGVIRVPNEIPETDVDQRGLEFASKTNIERSYRYGNNSARAIGHQMAVDARGEASGLRLLTTLRSDGNCRAAFRIHIRHWTSEVLNLELPEGARDSRITIAGQSMRVEPRGSDGRVLAIPVPNNDAWTAVTVDYELPRVTTPVMAHVPRSPPTGPFDLDAVRYVWHLGPGWRPINGSTIDVLPGMESKVSVPPLLDWRKWAGIRGDLATPTTATTHANVESALAAAFPAQTIIVDLRATAMAGVLPSESADSGTGLNWIRTRGLIVTECPSGVLLTAPAELESWRQGGSWRATWPAEVATAIAEAAAYGQDNSTRFCTLSNWASASEPDPDWLRAPTGWLIAFGEGDAAGLQVYRSDRAEGASWLLAIVFASAALVLRRRRRISALLLLAMAGAAVVVYSAQPEFASDVAAPLLIVSAVAACAYAWKNDVETVAAGKPRGFWLLVSIAVTILVAATAVVRAAPAASVEVLQIPDGDGKTSWVLVPRVWHDRLRGAQPRLPPGVVLTSATYSGRHEAAAVRFNARYRLYSFRDGPTTVTIPVIGVRFRAVSLDGAEAKDIDSAAEGLRIALSGKGVHTVDLEFAVPVTSDGVEQEVKFAVPEVALAKLHFELRKPAGRPRTGAWRGALRTATTPDGVKLDADLGAIPTVHLLWSRSTDVNSIVRTKEAAIWQVADGSATLRSLIEYRVAGGLPTELQIAIPTNAEVCRVVARGESGIAGPATVRLRDWSVVEAKNDAPRKLRVELLQPVAGRVVVELEMALAALAGEEVALHFPRALGVHEAEVHAAIDWPGADQPATIATSGLADSSAEAFLDPVWTPLSGSAYSGTVWRAFRGSGSLPCQISFAVRPARATKSVNETSTWWVEPNRATAVSESRWTGNSFSLIEWSAPSPSTVTEIVGRNVASWSRSGDRIQVWLDRPTSEAALTWRASMPLTGPAASAIEIPAVDYDARSAILVRRVRPMNGWGLIERAKGERLALITPQGAGEIAWRAAKDRPVAFSLVPPQAIPALDSRITVRASADRFDSIHRIDFAALPADRPHVFSLLLSCGRDDDVQLTTPPTISAYVAPSQAGRRRWDVFVPARRQGPSVVTVNVASVAAAIGNWRLPRASVRAGPGNELIATEAVSVESDHVALTDVDGLEQIGPTKWLARGRRWQASVARSVGLTRGEPARIISADIIASRSGRTWVFHGRYRLVASQSLSALAIAPTGSRFHTASLDGKSVGSVDSTTTRIVVPAALGPHEVNLAWSASVPVWTPALLEWRDERIGCDEVNWTVFVPRGTQIHSPASNAVPVSSSPVSRHGVTNDARLTCLGSPRRFRTTEGQALDVQVADAASDRHTDYWAMATTWGLWSALLALIVFVPNSTWVEQASCFAGIALVAMGPQVAVLSLVLVLAVAWRIRAILMARHNEREV